MKNILAAKLALVHTRSNSLSKSLGCTEGPGPKETLSLIWQFGHIRRVLLILRVVSLTLSLSAQVCTHA